MYEKSWKFNIIIIINFVYLYVIVIEILGLIKFLSGFFILVYLRSKLKYFHTKRKFWKYSNFNRKQTKKSKDPRKNFFARYP